MIWRGGRGSCLGCCLSERSSAVSVAADILSSETLDKMVCLDPVADTILAVVWARCNESAA